MANFTPHSQRTQRNGTQCLKQPQLIETKAMINVWKCLPTPYFPNKAFYKISEHPLFIHCTIKTPHPNYCIPCNATVIKSLNFAFEELWYRDTCNPMEYTRNTLTQENASVLTLSKNSRITESKVNQTWWWFKLIKCFKFWPCGRNTPLSRHCFGRINLLGGLNRWRREYTFETPPFFNVYVPGESYRYPHGHQN